MNVNEVCTEENNSVINLDTPEFIGQMLEKVIRKNVHNMREFSSLGALYLFEEGEKIGERKYKLIKKEKVHVKHYGIKG